MTLPDCPIVRPLSGIPRTRPLLVFADARVESGFGVPWLDEAVRHVQALSLCAGATIPVRTVTDHGVGSLIFVTLLDGDSMTLRTATAEAVAFMHKHCRDACTVVMPDFDTSRIQAIAEGIFSANHRFSSSSFAKDARRHFGNLDFAAANLAGDVVEGLRAGWLSSLATLSARDLATEPANVLTPPDFAERCRQLAERAGFRITIMGREELAAAKMGGLLAVASGSRHEPYLIRMEWLPADKTEDQRPLVLVGKTVTFDSGGISLKKAEDMDHMKADLGGGAAVFGVMNMVAELKPRFAVTAIFAVAENMPGPDAMRPSDVIRVGSGATVEIVNTDAEGRLILADALYHARGLDPAAVIDLATLTGASLGIFGPIGIGTFSNDDRWFDRLVKADDVAGEKVWRLPLWAEYRDFLKSPIADLRNYSSTGQNGSTPVAAAFLSHFVGEHPWLHLDLYNTCWNQKDLALMPQGPTGSGSRVLAQLILNLEAEASSQQPVSKQLL